MNRKFAFFALGFATALFLFQITAFNFLTAIITMALAVMSSVCLILFKHKTQGVLLASGAIVALVFFIIYPVFNPIPVFDKKDVEFSAIASDYSYSNSIDTGTICDVKVTALDGDKLDHSFSARIYFGDKRLTLTPGDKIKGVANFKVPKNDDDFNAFTYYKVRGIDAVGFCDDSVTSKVDSSLSFEYIPKWFAHEINNKIFNLLPRREAGFISAVILGNKTDFEMSDSESFKTIGLSHVVAVSGMHLVFLAGLISLLFGKYKTIFISLPILIIFTLIVGAPPSIVRALVMQSLVLLAPVLKGENDSINSLSIAMVLILFLNPYAVMDIGFQLSFLSTLGIILFSNRINNFLRKPFSFENKLANKILNSVTVTLATTLSALVFTTPIIAWHFRTVALIAPIANLLVLWAVNLLFVVSVIAILISFIYAPIAKIIMVIVAWFSEMILDFTVFLSSIPFASVYIETALQVILFVYFYVVLFLFIKDKKRSCKILSICIAVVMVLYAIIGIIADNIRTYNGLRFSVLDVGQGSAMLVDYNDTAIMVDCGGSRNKNAGDIALDYMHKEGISDLDAIVLTHFDYDHTNGVHSVFQELKVKSLYIPKVANDARAEAIVALAQEYGTAIHYIDDETHVSVNGLDFVIYPANWFDESNNNGLVVLFTKDNFELIITGDLSKKSEMLLCEKYDIPDVDAYIVGHHGAKDSSCMDFMNVILPEFAVISVGEGNYYGHPHKETLSLFDDMGIVVHRTDLSGNVVFYSDELEKEVS